MRGALKALAPFVRLVAAYPLHLAAALLAAVIAEALLTIQPQLLSGFIDSMNGGVPKRALWAFPAFMASAAVLAYAFDFISVAIRYALERGLERELKDVYLEVADKGRAEVVQYSMWSGIGKLSDLALAVTVDFCLVVSRIAIILAFLSFGHPGLGLAALAGVVLGTAATVATTTRLGRISKTIEFGTGRSVSFALASALASARRALRRVYALDERLFALKSVNVAISFTLFRVLPIGVVAWSLAGAELSLGDLASVFLYVSMLRGPYLDLIALLQESIVSLSESGLFREELERGLALRDSLRSVPVGLVWERSASRLGSPLSSSAEAGSRTYFDDASGEAKERLLEALARRARRRSVLVFSEDPALARYAHFVRSPDGGIRTVLA